MGQDSKIEWCHHTFNPWWGCVKVSDGCKNCYAEGVSHRFGGDLWGVNKPRRMMSRGYWYQPLKWNRGAEKQGERRRVFCGSMCDVFEDRQELIKPRSRLFQLINQTPHLDWLLLTKRPENIKRFWPFGYYDEQFHWPNIWLGTSVESQEMADKRISELLEVPAKVRFLSCEPLLEKIDLESILWPNKCGHRVDVLRGGYWNKSGIIACGPSAKLGEPKGGFTNHSDMNTIDWVIVGGESGHNARPVHPDWARSIRDQCVAAETPFLFKQWGEWAPYHELRCNEPGIKGKQWFNFDPDTAVCKVGKKKAGRLLDGREWNEYPEVAR